MNRFGSMNGEVPPLAAYWHKKLAEGNGSLDEATRAEALRNIEAAKQQQAAGLVSEVQDAERRRLLSSVQ